MRGVFVPVGWVVNRMIDGDYGIDFDVQLFEQHKATGEWFKVQLKSSASTEYSAKGDFISETLEMKHARHYCVEMRDPVFVIHADVRGGRIFWFAPQLRTDLINGVDDSRGSVTLRIETRNELPATLPEMVAALRLIRIRLGARTVSESHISDFASTVDGRDQEKLIKKFQDKVDALKLQKAHSFVNEGRLDDAQADIERVLSNSESSIESRFSFLLEQERVDFLRASNAGAPQSTTPEIHLRISRRLQDLTKNGPPPLKFFALIARKAGDLGVLTFRDFGLSMNWMGHVRGGGDPTIAVQLAIERLRSSHRIVRAYSQCVRLAGYAARSRHRWALPLALLRVVDSISAFILRLRYEGQADDASRYRDSAMRICALAVWIAERNQDDGALFCATTTVMRLAEKRKENVEIVRVARETLSKIKDPQYFQVADEILGRAIRRMTGEGVEDDHPHDLLKEIVENRATGLGIDMTDTDDPMVRLVRLGIKDVNPERVLRHCEHTLVSVRGTRSPVVLGLSQALQLPSILGKRIHCKLHDYSVEGRTLDDVCEKFKEKHCNSCADVSPRPANWKYSDEWQEQENQRAQEFMARFFQKRYGI